MSLPFWTRLMRLFKKRKRTYTRRDTEYWANPEVRRQRIVRGKIQAAYRREISGDSQGVVNG